MLKGEYKSVAWPIFIFSLFSKNAFSTLLFLTTSLPTIETLTNDSPSSFRSIDHLMFDSVSDLVFGSCLLCLLSLLRLSTAVSFPFSAERTIEKVKAFIYFYLFATSFIHLQHLTLNHHAFQPSSISFLPFPYILKHKNLVFLPNAFSLVCVNTQDTQ